MDSYTTHDTPRGTLTAAYANILQNSLRKVTLTLEMK